MSSSTAPSNRVFNFSAGPSCLPVEVLEKVAKETLAYQDSGMSVMEMSHRGSHFKKIYETTIGTLNELMKVPDTHQTIFMHGGATHQFSSLPFNFGPAAGATTPFADYIVSGSWSKKAVEEAEPHGVVNVINCKKDGKFQSVPAEGATIKTSDGSNYLYYCANETVMGVEFKKTPLTDIPIVADMSSNFLSKPIDVPAHKLIFAGVQKNLGPSSAAVVVAEKEWIKKSTPDKRCPTLMNYQKMFENDSLYNTPACWVIYVCGETAQWIKKNGGLEKLQEINEKKSSMLYSAIDGSDGYYTNPVCVSARSNMNIPFLIKGGDEPLEKTFVKEAEKQGLVCLAGHRSVGGCRASIYNAMPVEGVAKLVDFMKSFRAEHP